MAYTPINWQTGDTITAEKMNKMDNGWGVESSSQTLFNETVTTVDDGGIAWGDFEYTQLVNADSLTITFNGTSYECTAMTDGATFFYGGWAESGGEYAPDFSVYPFAYASEQGANYIATENESTYTVTAYASTSTIETSANFQTAVKSSVDTSTMPMLCVSGTTTRADMYSAIRSGRILFFQPYGISVANISIITSVGSDSVTFFPTDSSTQTSFVDGVFVVSHT